MKTLKDYFSPSRSSDSDLILNSPDVSVCENIEKGRKKRGKNFVTNKSKKRKLKDSLTSPNEESFHSSADELLGITDKVKKIGKYKRKSSHIGDRLKQKKNKVSQLEDDSNDTSTKNLVSLDIQENGILETTPTSTLTKSKKRSEEKSKKRKRSKDMSPSVDDDFASKINQVFLEVVTMKSAQICSPPNNLKEKETEEVKETKNIEQSLEPKEGDNISPSNKKNLFNYFNKTDKTFMVKEDKVTISVKALVHTPPSLKKRISPDLKPKRNIKKGRDISAEFDLITSEEDSFSNDSESIKENIESNGSSQTSRTPWKMRITLTPNHNCEDLLDEEDPVSSLKDSSDVSSKSSIVEDMAENLSIDKSPIVEDDSQLDIDSTKAEKEGPIVEDDSQMDRDSTKINKGEANIESIILVDEDSCQVVSENLQPKTKPTLRGNSFAAYFGSKLTGSKGGKTPLNEQQIQARKEFLESGTPTSLKKPTSQREEEVEAEGAKFPRVSHVRQSQPPSDVWSRLGGELKLRSEPAPLSRRPTWSRLTEPTDPDGQQSRTRPQVKVKKALNQLIQEMEGVPISEWYKVLKEAKKGSDRWELWSDRYRPKSFTEALINTAVMSELNSWLEAQANIGQDSSDESSGEEFINGEEVQKRVSNTALLIGPPGSGKTTAVYAAAKSNGYQVLELNSTCNRNGKRILNEFSEATQSHKVETKSLLKIKKKKKKETKLEDKKKSLILIEDADMVFSEYDDGFTASLSILREGSKRPLVLIVNDDKVKHLAKVAPPNDSLHLHFKHTTSRIISGFLRTVSLVEGHCLSDEECQQLLCRTDCDLRRALLQLQFLLSDNTLMGKEECTVEMLTGLCTKSPSLSRTISDMDFISRSLHHMGTKWSEIRESTSLVPSEEHYSPLLGAEISHFLISRVRCRLTESPFPSTRFIEKESEITDCLPAGTQLCHESVAMYYMPTLRSMARSETHRLATHSKRKRRLFNYLANIGFPSKDAILTQLVSSLN